MKKILLITGLLFGIASFGQLRLVKDVNGQFQQHSYPKDFFTFNGKLYFSAIGAGSSPFFQHFIYSSDGTSIGTSRVQSGIVQARIAPGSSVHYVEHNGNLVLSIMDFNTTGDQINKLFRVNASDNSVSDLVNLSTIYDPNADTFGSPLSFNNKIFFSPITTGQPNPPTIEQIKIEPYMTDLTQGGTTVLKDIMNYDINNGSSSFPSDFTILNTNLFFSAESRNEGREIWKSDGTTVGTVLYLDLNTGVTDSNPTQLNVLGTQLTFVATHSTLGRELFRTNGIGSLTVLKDINTSGDSNPVNVTRIGTDLYFSATNGTVGQELWKSNGTNLGTIMVKDINPSGDSNASKFTQMGTSIYFTANDGTNGVELWKTDGTGAGTVLVKDINPTGNSNPNYLKVYNGKLYFTADNGNGQSELWVSDGTAIGTTSITVNASGGSSVSNLYVFNSELYFAANAGSNLGVELYAYMDPALSTNDFSLKANTIKLFPNPSKNYFELSGDVNIENVGVYSLQGQLVKSYKIQNQYTISDLSKGMYILKINATEGTLNKTLIVE